jgi:hypothetical protein
VQLDARILAAPRLSFSRALPSRVHTHPYRGMQTHGPFDSSRVVVGPGSVLFVFPESLLDQARTLARALLKGHGNFPGFEALFRVPFGNDNVANLQIDTKLNDPAQAALDYRTQIEAWNRNHREAAPQLALVLVPHSERWETDRAYYEAKSMFARLGIPTQMVTSELLADEREFQWSIANIALAMFAKLGGVPWVVEAPPNESDLIVGVGRAEVRRGTANERIFGYAVTFTSNGAYRHLWGFTPAGDEATYGARLEEALTSALTEDVDRDQPFERLVVHLTKRTGRREIEAVRTAIEHARVPLKAAFVRLDDSTLYDIADGGTDTLAPPKGLAVRLSARRVLLQAEGLGPLGPPEGPILLELDERSDVGSEAVDGLAEQAFRLALANWRAFNARSQPVTLAYGELLAKLVGYLEEVETWDPSSLRSELRERPWFL